MKAFNVWEGIYPSFKEAPCYGDGYQSKIYLSKNSKLARKELALSKSKVRIPTAPSYGESLLPALVAVLADRSRFFRVLDFGGGMGITYLRMKNALSPRLKIRYVIVDLPEVCREGRKVLKAKKDIRFVSRIPDAFLADIVHLGVSLQYTEDWKQVLSVLSKNCKQYFSFTNFFAGDIPSYVTAQNYYGSKIPVHFLNIDEVLGHMKHLGFELLFKSSYDAKILGKYEHCPQENFPVRYRLGKSCNLLFRKI